MLKQKGLQYWLPYYLMNKLRLKEKSVAGQPMHIFLCVVDHYEPFNGNVDYKTALGRVQEWRKKYPAFADQHRDFDGKPIQHTWFYPPHLDHSFLSFLAELCLAGYGDIEMHLHHNHMDPFPDTSQTLRDKILRCIDDYGKFGIFTQPNGHPRFAFIHGDWSLDNSGGRHLCGVNDELTILRECGCFADFTFPSLNVSQPAMINSIYYAFDDPDKPKSYNRGIPVKIALDELEGALLMIQGILGIRYDDRKKIRFSIETSDLDSSDPPTIARVDYLVKNALTVKGKPGWKFIKLHTHGAPEIRWSVNFGDDAHRAFDYLEKTYNDGEKYILHYVTAREMYNIIKSAESGQNISPSKSRDYLVSPYVYSP
ncbi:hypothetical protein C4565_09490 [Candidatus Parcubacteria bacterium]|nr:MAG: hypothetical protein C4565_09490 [Candidatus Parcubacteria bacterium]